MWFIGKKKGKTGNCGEKGITYYMGKMYLLAHLVQLHWVDNYMEVFCNCYRYQENILLIETSPSLYIQFLTNLTLHYRCSTATTFADLCIALLLTTAKGSSFCCKIKKKVFKFFFSFMRKLYFLRINTTTKY